ncbi:hypothetical protein BDW66DRAFT_151092 [Aspergillus desertorum]
MDILKAIRWGIQVWDLDLSDQTIINCFQKGLYDKSAPDDPNSIENRVLVQFQEPQGVDVEEEDIDHEIEVQTPVTSHNALTALRTLRLYLEQQEEGDTG